MSFRSPCVHGFGIFQGRKGGREGADANNGHPIYVAKGSQGFGGTGLMRPVSIKLRDGLVIASQAWATEDVSERIEGWLKKKETKPGDGILIAPCASIHTLGMTVTIDVVFLDAKLKVTKIRRRVRPNRFAFGTLKNLLISWDSEVLELPQDAAAAVNVGDCLEVIPRTL